MKEEKRGLPACEILKSPVEQTEKSSKESQRVMGEKGKSGKGELNLGRGDEELRRKPQLLQVCHGWRQLRSGGGGWGAEEG